MTAPYLNVPVFSWPAAPGGLLYTYAPGGVSAKTTYEADGVTPNTNPVVLDVSGTAVVRGEGLYHFLLKDSTGTTTLWDADYYASSPVSQETIGGYLYPRTVAEVAAGVTPTTYGYKEGDVRRYGADTAAANNSVPFHTALDVSAHGGSAAYFPAGTWLITAAIVAPAGSSMYGDGRASVISVANGIDGLQFTGSDAGIVAQPRFFRDFQILGTLSGTANVAHGIYINTTTVDHTQFSNIAIFNFEYGMYVKGLYYSSIQNCWIQNCYQGLYFSAQSVNVYCLNNTIQLTSSGTVITGTGTSKGISCSGAPEIEGLHIQGGSIYGYNYNMNFGLIFECQVEAVDISFATTCPIFFSSTIGGVVIRDCWIELASSASGTWNDAGTGTGNLTGIFVGAVTPSVNSKVHIHGNYIISDVTIAGTTGVYVGNANAGLTCHDNQIIGFDVGIGGGNTLLNSGSATTGLSLKYNTINIVKDTTTTGVYSTSSSAINLNSLSADVEIGPNYVVHGTGAAATIAATSTITVPNQATAGNQQFPVGTPVQCTLTIANGPDARITYYVATSSTTAVTITNIPGAAAISWGGTGSIGNLVQAPDPVTYSAGTPPGTALYGRGAFFILLSDPVLSGVVLWKAAGGTVHLYPVAALTGGAGSVNMTATGLPPYLAPTTTQNTVCGVENNSAAAYGLCQVTTAAALTFKVDALATAFTNAGTKGLLNSSITYSLA